VPPQQEIQAHPPQAIAPTSFAPPATAQPSQPTQQVEQKEGVKTDSNGSLPITNETLTATNGIFCFFFHL
jgi:hypothetical protein